MRKVTVAVVAAIAVVALWAAASLTAQTAAPARFEYARLSRYGTVDPSDPKQIRVHTAGYETCVATIGEWACRRFPEPNGGFRTALATLGNEGWEAVSDSNSGATMLFKRQVR